MANKQSVAALRSRLYKWSGEGFQECNVGQRTGRARQAAPVVLGRDQAGRITRPVLVGAEVRLAACLDLGEQVAEVGAAQAGDEAGEAQRNGLPRLPKCFVGDVQGRDRQRRLRWRCQLPQHIVDAVFGEDPTGPSQKRARIGLFDALTCLIVDRAELLLQQEQQHF
jgi:hypothetical protein